MREECGREKLGVRKRKLCKYRDGEENLGGGNI